MPTTQAMTLKKCVLGGFLEALGHDYEVFLPAKVDNSVQYAAYKSGTAPDFSALPVFPVKEVFFTKREVLMTWHGTKISSPKIEGKPKALFGLRRCDLNAIRKQDIAFSGEYNDPYYQKRREGALLIGYHCAEAPSENCFCGSMDLQDSFDLMLYDTGTEYKVEVGTETGEKAVKRFAKFFSESAEQVTPEDKNIKGLRTLDYSGIKASESDKAWDKLIDTCLSCSACTALCPSCYCHEIRDEVNPLNVSAGERLRSWSSCQLRSFTRVAGDEIFRKDRKARYQHRLFHQFLYFEEKNGQPLCVGCGRCITHCPTKIDFVKILNDMPKNGGGGR